MQGAQGGTPKPKVNMPDWFSRVKGDPQVILMACKIVFQAQLYNYVTLPELPLPLPTLKMFPLDWALPIMWDVLGRQHTPK
jgi:hypothetical protein